MRFNSNLKIYSVFVEPTPDVYQGGSGIAVLMCYNSFNWVGTHNDSVNVGYADGHVRGAVKIAWNYANWGPSIAWYCFPSQFDIPFGETPRYRN